MHVRIYVHGWAPGALQADTKYDHVLLLASDIYWWPHMHAAMYS